MTLAAIRTALEGWAADVTGLPVRWRERAQQYGSDQILLHIRGVRGVGLDEVSETYDADTILGAAWGGITGGFTPTQTGQRVGTLEIRAEVQSQDSGEDALHYVTLLRDSLSLDDCVSALDAAEAAVGAILMEPTELSVTNDMRRLSVAQMDVAINAAAAVSGTPYGNIEHVDLTVVGQDEDGSTVYSIDATIEV